MKPETKAILDIFTQEILDCRNMKQVYKLVRCWIRANNLHPESVTTLTWEEYKQWQKALKKIKPWWKFW